jgi:para-aminobenzoate synthetase
LRHDGDDMWRGIPSGGGGLVGVRYHSLVVDPWTLPECLTATAWVDGDGGEIGDGSGSGRDGSSPPVVIMGMRHKTRPHYGVQYHPESVCSTHGDALYRNFAAAADAHWKRLGPPNAAPRPSRVLKGLDPSDVSSAPSACAPTPPGTEDGDGATKLLWAKLPRALAVVPGGAEGAFWGLHGGSGGGSIPGVVSKSEASMDSFWLDSATAATATATATGGTCPRSRFSFMGGRGGALWRRAIYRCPPPPPPSDENGPTADRAFRTGAAPAFAGGSLTVTDATGASTTRTGVSVLEWLESRLRSRRCRRAEEVTLNVKRSREDETSTDEPAIDDADFIADGRLPNLPFDFIGGFVGYLGYEIRRVLSHTGSHTTASAW